MLPEQQRRQWRGVAIYGLFVNLVTFLVLSLGSAVLGMGAEYLDSALQDSQPTRLFENPEPASYPGMALSILLISSPFVLAAILMLLKFQLFSFPDLSVLGQLIYANILLGLVMAVFVAITHLYAELYALNNAEFRMWMGLNRLVVYVYFMTLPLADLGIGIAIFQTRILPRSLGMITIGMAAINLIVNFLMLNSDLPSVRIIVNVPMFSVSSVIWTAYLWIITIPPHLRERTDTPTTPGK